MGGVLSGRQPELGTSLDKDLPPWLDWLMLALDRSWPFRNPRHVRVPREATGLLHWSTAAGALYGQVDREMDGEKTRQRKRPQGDLRTPQQSHRHQ